MITLLDHAPANVAAFNATEIFCRKTDFNKVFSP
jgi:hypothetical protein